MLHHPIIRQNPARGFADTVFDGTFRRPAQGGDLCGVEDKKRVVADPAARADGIHVDPSMG